MKKKLTIVNNIACAVLLIATFATMLLPCWDYTDTQKYKVRFCTYCGTVAELDSRNKVRDGYVCPGSSEMTVEEYEKKKLKKEETPAPEATEPTEEVTEEVEATEAVATEAVEARTVEPTEAVEATEAVTEEVEATETETTEEEATEAETTEEDKEKLITVACADVKAKYKMEQWTYEVPGNASIMGFVWTAFEHEGLSKQFEAEEIVINDVILAPFVLTLCGIVGLLFCIFNMKGTWHAIFLVPAGAVTVFAYLTNEIFKNENWILTLSCAGALTLASMALLTQFIIKIVKWFVVPCYKK